jgi:hypothetical protein
VFFALRNKQTMKLLHLVLVPQTVPIWFFHLCLVVVHAVQEDPPVPSPSPSLISPISTSMAAFSPGTWKGPFCFFKRNDFVVV